jgi:hypothetical protein
MKPSEEIEEVTVINEPTSATTYIDATGSKQTSRTVPNQSTFTGTPGAAVVNAMSTLTGSNLYDNAIRNKKDVTLAEANAVAERAVNADEAKKEVEEEKGGALTSAAMNAIASNPELQKMAQQTQPLDVEQVDISEQTTGAGGTPSTGVTTGGTTGGAPSGSPATSNIGGVVSSTEPQKPTYEGTATKEQVARDLYTLASELDFITPDAVMEKLELTDYYPNIGKDIAVGNWTGSVLGSQTIYSGAGGLLPMGLYDARKRAIAKAAKDKQAIIDKMMELPNTAEQFQKNYQDYGFQKLINGGLEKYGSYEAMAKSPEWRREFAKFKNIGIELTYYDKQADKTIKDLSDGTRYVPKQMRELAYKVKQGLADDIEDILSGKSNFLKEAGGFRSYENGTAHVDKLVKEGIFDKDRLSEMPINLKTAEAEANPKEYSDFVRSLSEGSRDNDTFVTQLKRFFDVSSAEKLIDALYTDNNFDPSTKKATLDYFLAQIPNQVVNEYKTMSNQAFEREKLASDNAWRQKEFDLRVQEGKTYYTILNESMDTPDQNGSTLNEKLSTASKNAKNMTLSQKRKAIKDAFNASGFATAFDPYSNTSVRVSKPSVQMTSKQIPVAPGRTMVRIQEWDAKKKDFVPRAITIQDLAAKAKSKKVRAGQIKAADGSVYTPADLEFMSKGIKSNTVRIRPQNLETTKGFVDSKGNLNSLTEFNLDAYNPNMSRNIHKVVGSASTIGAPIIDPETKKQRVDPDTGELMFESLPFKGEFYTEDDISDPSKRTPLDSHFGGKEVKYFKPQGETSTIYSGSSSSGAQ